ncbi:hypothetical protein LEMA_P113090.1 [Plenodomus lingam JN3]|uniref:Uncharacterized protein n=1 Tax=Leptosphaeria maculans (strain JN3 / isolate v23.1.3 / race Av1-4-5-6-7-8) TaxID=985895 RepID=E4ZYE5_LEPMJ|nr:hypothetical protein LEMA_P113090.1 [Plenodomus lingam JN3]CBX96390.1 hypothetical protein LEMA_P113090.1 [Plenodomus lingam JN3]
MGNTLERHPFSGLVHSADELTPFVVSDERAFWHLNPAFGSSRIASSAYQKWPTSNGTFKCPRSIK